LTLNGLGSMTVECHSSFTDPGATAIDACAGDVSSSIQVYGAVNQDAPGTYVITYVVVDQNGNGAGVDRTVTVVDTTPPSLTLNGDVSMTIECHSSFTDLGATASDICAGDLSSDIVVSGSVDQN